MRGLGETRSGVNGLRPTRLPCKSKQDKERSAFLHLGDTIIKIKPKQPLDLVVLFFPPLYLMTSVKMSNLIAAPSSLSCFISQCKMQLEESLEAGSHPDTPILVIFHIKLVLDSKTWYVNPKCSLVHLPSPMPSGCDLQPLQTSRFLQCFSVHIIGNRNNSLGDIYFFPKPWPIRGLWFGNQILKQNTSNP